MTEPRYCNCLFWAFWNWLFGAGTLKIRVMWRPPDSKMWYHYAPLEPYEDWRALFHWWFKGAVRKAR